jgi:NTE family protein
VRSDGGVDPGRPALRVKQIFLLSTRRPATPLAALTALVADQLREDLPGHRVGVLVVRSRRGEARPEPRALARARTRGLEVVEVDAEPAAMTGAVRQMRADTVLVDASARPLDWAEANLGGLVSKVVFLAREAFEPSPEAFREHPCVRTVLVRECPVGAQMAYHPRTVRLSFDSLEALARLALDELPSRDRDSVARLSRALSARRVGLALGGGAALGYAHIALLQELAAANMPVDLISGVSFGSLVAGLYVSGGVAALDALLEHSVTFQAVLMASTAIPPLTEWFLNGQLENRRLEYVETPFFPVSLNLQTCDEWSPTKGTLAAGIRGSSALPGFFSPFIAPGVRSVDGTFVNNVPEEILIREGANFVISSNVIEAPEPIPESRWGQVLSLAPWNRMKDNLRALAALNRIADERDRRLADLRFQPPRSGVPMWDFSKGRLIVERTRPEAKRFAHEAVRQWIGRSQA